MHARGYSLIELVVVIAIISILLAIGLPKFSEYTRRYKSEAQTRVIYDELLRARANAIYKRSAMRVKLYATRLEVYSSVADSENGARPVLTRQLSYPIVQSTSGNDIDFDERGVTFEQRSICIEAGDGTGVDSIVVGNLRTTIGTRGRGQSCNAENITRQ